MIRRVAIPPLRARLGQTLELSQGCVSYLDPATGLWMADGNTSADCNVGDGTSSDAPIVADPGLVSALQTFAAANSAQSSSDALNSLSVVSQGNPASSPIPGPGLGLVTLPSGLQTLLEIAAGVVILFLIFGQQQAGSRR